MTIIEDLLPHRGTMRLIDAIIHVTDDSAQTQATVRPGWPMADDHGVGCLVLIELAAQTAGISFGWKATQASGRIAQQASPAAQGWLVGVKQAQFFIDRLEIQSCIITQSKTVITAQDYKEVSATCHVGETLVGQIYLQVLQAASTAFAGVSG